MLTLNEVISAFATMNEDGSAMVDFDFASFDKLVSELYTKRAEIRKSNKEDVKNANKANKKALDEVGKKYYKSLKLNEEFTYKTADGTVVTAKKIETKSGSDARASCEVISGITFKSANHKRYPEYNQIVIPADFGKEETKE